MTGHDLSLLAVCALAAAAVSATVAYSKIAWPLRHVAARWAWSWALISCAWCTSAYTTAAALVVYGPNVEHGRDWPLLWLACWGAAGLVAAAVRVVALPAVEPIREHEMEEA